MTSKIRTPFIAGNWKMNLTLKESLELVCCLHKGISSSEKSEVLIATPFTALNTVSQALRQNGSSILLAAQDMHWEEKGAYTGAVSPAQIKDAGCSHVILGHSERRRYFGETDETVKKKVRAAVKCGITPIVCIGETLEERESQRTYRVLETQVGGGLGGFDPSEISGLIVAYEPVWAIGTGRTATPEQAQDAHLFIRRRIEKLYGGKFSQSLRILYGGSVKPENVDSIMAQPDVDGALVGGESLKAERFLRIVHFQEVISRQV